MKALVKKHAKRGLWLEEVPRPKIQPNELLMRVRKAAICGTDLHIYEWDEWAQSDTRVPVTVGHEFVGEIVEVGSAVQGWSVGQRICAEGHIYCGYCRNCRTDQAHLCLATYEALGRHRDGGFAEYVALPAINAVAIPDSIPDEFAAIFDPFGNAVHTALSFDIVAKDVLITGAGPIGMMAAAVCRHAGARQVVITDFSPERLAIAKRMGASRTVDLSKESLEEVIKELKIEGGFSVGLEMSGAPSALQSMIDQVAPGGEIALLGILPKDSPVDWHKVIFKGLTLKGIYGRKLFKTWFQLIRMVESGVDLSPVITHAYPLERFEEAFATLLSGKAAKVLLDIS